jgi:uncharacterized phiE125 gp8 family phage protein
MIIERQLPHNGNSSWKVTTPPATEPVTVDELKLFARIDGTEEDTILSLLITAIRESCEGYCGRAFITQTITMKLDFWPGDVVELPRPPLISVLAVELLDESDVITTFASANYYTVVEAIPCKLIVKRDVQYPFQNVRDYGGYQIRFTCGYGDDASDVPNALRQAILQWATYQYEERSSNYTSDSLSRVMLSPPKEVEAVLNMYRVPRIGASP